MAFVVIMLAVHRPGCVGSILFGGGNVSEAQQTQVVTLARDPDLVVGNRLHCLELIDCFDVGRRHVVGPLWVRIGDRLRP